MHADSVEAGKLRELEAWGKFDDVPRMRAVKYRTNCANPAGADLGNGGWEEVR